MFASKSDKWKLVKAFDSVGLFFFFFDFLCYETSRCPMFEFDLRFCFVSYPSLCSIKLPKNR